MNHRGRVVAAIALAMASVVSLVGCSGKVKIVRAASQLCEANGGQYDAGTEQCRFTAPKIVSARQACEALGGVDLPDRQWCQLED